MRFTYQHQGQTYTLDLATQPNGQYVVSIGDKSFPVQAQALPNGGWRLIVDGRSHVVYTAAQADQRDSVAPGRACDLAHQVLNRDLHRVGELAQQQDRHIALARFELRQVALRNAR